MPKTTLKLSRLLVVKSVSFVVLLILFRSSLSAQYHFLENGGPLARGSDLGFLLDTPTRTKIDLSGIWDYAILGGPSGKVQIPSAYDFTGEVAFERTFVVTPEEIDRYKFHLVMLGANYDCQVYLNGDFVTNHFGGYTSFIQTIPPNVLQVGDANVIRIVINNRLDSKKTLPLQSQVWGWRNYGGVLRDVYIMGTPAFYIGNIVAQSHISENNANARISVKASFEGEMRAPVKGVAKPGVLGFYIELLNKISGVSEGRSQVVPLTQQGNLWQDAVAEINLLNPKLWSPANPELYFLKCHLVESVGREHTVIDEYHHNYGVRKIELKDGRILLNGVRFDVKGVVWYEDHPSWGSAMTYEELERDIVLIKNLGANVVRYANHPPHPYMLNLCDRYGLMALEELPVTGVPAQILNDDQYIEQAQARLREMILRDRNHPCVLAWGIGDEFETSTMLARRFVETMTKLAKELDNRPTYYGSRLIQNDICTDLVDLAAVNIHSRDLKQFKKDLEDWKARHPGKTAIITKFGTEVQQDNHNGYSDPLSHEAQARFYVQRFDVVKNSNYAGAIIWSFNDWKGDRPALTVNSGDPWMHLMGLVTYQRDKRLAYEAVRSTFNSEKFVALPIGSHSSSEPVVFVLSGLVVLIGAAYFYNVSRRFRESVNRSLLNSYNFFSDIRDQRVVPIIVTTILGVIVSVATGIVFASLLYHFRGNWFLDNLLSYILVYDSFKETIVRLIWDPMRFVGYFSAAFFLLLLLTSVLVLLLAPLFKARIYPFHAYSVTMWSTPPLLALVPVGMILYRVLDAEIYVVPALMLFALLFIWVFLRFLKGVAIVFDALPAKVYVAGTLSVAGLLAAAYFYLDATQSTSIYLKYMYDVMSKSG